VTEQRQRKLERAPQAAIRFNDQNIHNGESRSRSQARTAEHIWRVTRCGSNDSSAGKDNVKDNSSVCRRQQCTYE
jgi:hypothetical protein